MELALSIPLLVVLMALLVQLTAATWVQLAVHEAARAGARAAAVDPRPDAATKAAKAATGLNPTKLEIKTSTNDGDGFVHVEASFPVTVRMPVTNTALITRSMRSAVAMPLEFRW